MELKDIQRKTEPKTVRLNLKTTKKASKWMKDNNVSPQKVFDMGLEEVMEHDEIMQKEKKRFK